MKNFMDKKYLIPIFGAVSFSVLSVQNAHASFNSAFNSSVGISYTINSIVNTTTTENDLNGLNITGSFSLDTLSSSIDIPLGSDGIATPISTLTSTNVDPVINVFSKTMNINGGVNDGRVNAYYLGLFDLTFDNTSANSFDIQVTLNYDLTAAASGQYAETAIQLDYFNEVGGFDSGIAGYSIIAMPFAPGDLSGTAVYNFTLLPSSMDALYVNAGVSGYAEASPVPLPGAFGLFASALVVPLFKRKHKLTAC